METDIKKENEKKKQYLLQYRDALRAEKQIEEEITQLRLDTMMPAVVNDGMPHGSGGCGDLSGYAAAMDRLMDDLKKQLEKRIAIRREITERIEAMTDETEKLVLKLRYIHCMTWEKIKKYMDIQSLRQVFRVHGHALKNFKMIDLSYNI